MILMSITNGVCSVSRTKVSKDTDLKANVSVNPNKEVFDDTCNFCIDGHPVDARGKQESPCKPMFLPDFTNDVNLNNSTLGKSTSNYCDKDVQKISSKGRKLD